VLQWTAIGCVVAASAGATLFTQTSHDRDTTVLPAA